MLFDDITFITIFADLVEVDGRRQSRLCPGAHGPSVRRLAEPASYQPNVNGLAISALGKQKEAPGRSCST